MSFGGLNISVSGLLASQVGLDVTSNNIANTNTVGYSRQSVTFSEGIISGFRAKQILSGANKVPILVEIRL
jgi:flagellar hook-associated protein FlgK